MKKTLTFIIIFMFFCITLLTGCGNEIAEPDVANQTGEEEKENDIVEENSNGTKNVDESDTQEIVLQNTAFQIFEPAPGSRVKNQIIVRGLARTYEGTVLYEFEDGYYILAEGFTTASEGAPGWGEFEIIIELDTVANYSGRVILFEESAKDGSRINELQIPVEVIE